MATEEILIQQRESGFRIGRLVDRTELGYVILWEDQPNPVTQKYWPEAAWRAPAGGIEHRAVTAAATVSEDLAKDPESVFVTLLQEREKGHKQAEITTALVRVGIDEKAVAAAWKLVRRTLPVHPHIRASGKPTTYQWTSTPRSPDPVTKPVKQPPTPRPSPVVTAEPKPLAAETRPKQDASSEEPEVGASSVTPPPTQRPTAVVTPEAKPPAVAKTSPAQNASSGESAVGASSVEPPTKEPPTTPRPTPVVTRRAKPAAAKPRSAQNASESLVDRIRTQSHGSVEWPAANRLMQALRTPLAIGVELAKLPERALAAAVDQARAEKRPDILWLLVTTARSAEFLDKLAKHLREGEGAATASAMLLTNLSSELFANVHPAEADAISASLILVRIGPAAAKSADSINSVLAFTKLPKTSPVADRLVIAALDVLTSAENQVLQAALTGADVLMILTDAAVAPLVAAGGRARLIAAAHRSGSDAVTNSAVWHGVQANDLARLIDAGELSAVLSSPGVAERVASILAAAIKAVETRRQLAELLSWPTQLVEQAPPGELAGAIRRVLYRDAHLGKAIEAATGKVQLDEELGRLKTANEQQEAQLQATREFVSTERKRADDFESRMREQLVGSYEATEAQRRQLRIDGLRTAISLLEQLDLEAADLPELEPLRDQLLLTAAQDGISAIGHHGERVEFDRTLHEIVAGPEKSTVTIIRSGYSWTNAGSITVLRRALVSTAD
jgi:molecular chaperone GrpE (heat shock protein)